MADVVGVYPAGTLIYTGKGQLLGCIISCSSATAALATFYDNTAGSGTKLLEAHVSSYAPLVILFGERFAPAFETGLYLALAANLTATVWSRQI